MTGYFRPLVQHGPTRPEGALPLAGGPLWFTHAEFLTRDAAPRIVEAGDVPEPWLTRLSSPRAPVAGLDWSLPRIMGILNVTPDSFSDGGRHFGTEAAFNGALSMVQAGADIIDVGGESTRPGAREMPAEEEIARVVPAISALRAASAVPISIDTRKARVADAAADAGADLVNDVSAFLHDPVLIDTCVARNLPVCLMHMRGDPENMQDDPHYDHVTLDVFDHLAARIAALEAHGIPRSRIVADPGIGFGKTVAHNLALLQNIALFHGLGVAILLGVSRKGFIGRIGKAQPGAARAPGSIAVGLAGLAQGVQILRVHDVAETAQALRLWRAVR